MTVDWDGKIRMDCSSPYAMAPLIALQATASTSRSRNDTDHDRHGIVTPSGGPDESESLSGGGDLLSVHPSARVAADAGGRQDRGQQQHHRSRGGADSDAACSKYRSDSSGSWMACCDGSLGFGGEESAGASFLRRDGTAWTTDKDGIILGLLAAEITATLGAIPGALRRAHARVRRAGLRTHRRARDARAETAPPAALAGQVDAKELAGERHPSDPDDRARQRRSDRRAEGDDRRRLVCGAAVRH